MALMSRWSLRRRTLLLALAPALALPAATPLNPTGARHADV